jgi:hypothetical protein
MKIAGLIVGIILVLIGLSSAPGALMHFKDEDVGVVLGRLTCVGCEVLGGGLLIFFCIRGVIRDSKRK